MVLKRLKFSTAGLIYLLATAGFSANSQEAVRSRTANADNAPTWSVKSNVLGWATTSPNAAFEVKVADKWTINTAVSYNPFSFKDNKKLKHILVQPEARYWFCAPYSGHFIGGHLLYSHFNAGGIKLPFGIYDGLKDNRYQGNLYGAGFVYGYHLMLSPRWSVEFAAGIGYGYTKYEKYDCQTCGAWRAKEGKHLFMPTKLAISFIYIIK